MGKFLNILWYFSMCFIVSILNNFLFVASIFYDLVLFRVFLHILLNSLRQILFKFVKTIRKIFFPTIKRLIPILFLTILFRFFLSILFRFFLNILFYFFLTILFNSFLKDATSIIIRILLLNLINFFLRKYCWKKIIHHFLETFLILRRHTYDIIQKLHYLWIVVTVIIVFKFNSWPINYIIDVIINIILRGNYFL